MELKTNRNVAVFDLDGVIVRNPDAALASTVTDNDFWFNHWTRPEESELNDEMVELARSLVSTNWQLVILTARPGRYRKETERLLYRAGIFVRPTSTGKVVTTNHSNAPILVMLDQHDVPAGSAGWKQTMIRQWQKSGVKVRLMIEDYRQNAEAIRSAVPVLLYERKKVSRHLHTAYPCCGGLTTCWCPAADIALARANGA